MYVEIAEIDADGMRSKIHGFSEVVYLSHGRESVENNGTARVNISLENGTETLKQNGCERFEVVTIEQQ